MHLSLSPASLADLPFIMATERLPGYDKLVGRWEEGEHRKAFADPLYRYFRADVDGAPAGFVLLRGWNAPDHVTLIKRAAIAHPGQGLGRRMIAAVVARIFEETEVYRIAIGCFPENLRARKAYEAAGFTVEGITRGSAWFYGEHRDELLLSLLRPEWTRAHRL